MNHTGLIIALAVAVAAGLAFGLNPGLDVRIAQYFHDQTDSSRHAFAWRVYPPLMLARNVAFWITTVLVAPAVAALVVELILPRRKMLIAGRAALFLVATLALGPGLLVNVALKDHWGRPRPIDIAQLGGTEHFVPWWN